MSPCSILGWVGSPHCSIPCINGYHYYDHDGVTGNDDIIPHLACGEVDAITGDITAWFGYTSFNSRVVTIDVGPDNEIDGASVGFQEFEFRPGYHQYVFSVG